MKRPTIVIPAPTSTADDYPLMSSRQVLSLYQRSLAGKWQLPPETRQAIASFAAGVLSDAEAPIRAKTNAAKVLVSLDNLESQERRSLVELTLRHELAGALADSLDQPLSELKPLEGESMVDDSPYG